MKGICKENTHTSPCQCKEKTTSRFSCVFQQFWSLQTKLRAFRRSVFVANTSNLYWTGPICTRDNTCEMFANTKRTPTASLYCFPSVKFKEKMSKPSFNSLGILQTWNPPHYSPPSLASIGKRSRLAKAPGIPASTPTILLLAPKSNKPAQR